MDWRSKLPYLFSLLVLIDNELTNVIDSASCRLSVKQIKFDLWFKTQSDRASASIIADEEFAHCIFLRL